MTASRRGGRPPIAAGKRRSETLRVMVTRAERDRIKEICRDRGASYSNVLRTIIREALDARPKGVEKE